MLEIARSTFVFNRSCRVYVPLDKQQKQQQQDGPKRENFLTALAVDEKDLLEREFFIKKTKV
jgi:hypothetical protein